MRRLKTILLSALLASTHLMASDITEQNTRPLRPTNPHSDLSALTYLQFTAPEEMNALRAAFPHASNPWLNEYIRTEIMEQHALPTFTGQLSQEAAHMGAQFIVLCMAMHYSRNGLPFETFQTENTQNNEAPSIHIPKARRMTSRTPYARPNIISSPQSAYLAALNSHTPTQTRSAFRAVPRAHDAFHRAPTSPYTFHNPASSSIMLPQRIQNAPNAQHVSNNVTNTSSSQEFNINNNMKQ